VFGAVSRTISRTFTQPINLVIIVFALYIAYSVKQNTATNLLVEIKTLCKDIPVLKDFTAYIADSTRIVKSVGAILGVAVTIIATRRQTSLYSLGITTLAYRAPQYTISQYLLAAFAYFLSLRIRNTSVRSALALSAVVIAYTLFSGSSVSDESAVFNSTFYPDCNLAAGSNTCLDSLCTINHCGPCWNPSNPEYDDNPPVDCVAFQAGT
jgi:hypothetical protein